MREVDVAVDVVSEKRDAIGREDLPAVETAFHKAVEAANAFHELRDKPYIRWKLPDAPPPDLDLTPRKK